MGSYVINKKHWIKLFCVRIILLVLLLLGLVKIKILVLCISLIRWTIWLIVLIECRFGNCLSLWSMRRLKIRSLLLLLLMIRRVGLWSMSVSLPSLRLLMLTGLWTVLRVLLIILMGLISSCLSPCSRIVADSCISPKTLRTGSLSWWKSSRTLLRRNLYQSWLLPSWSTQLTC